MTTCGVENRMVKAEPKLVVLSGCSGGGKSTLLDALHARGFAIVPEPGRRIIAKERELGGNALPWLDPETFAHRAVELALDDLAEARKSMDGWIFFDRGLIDAISALSHLTGRSLAEVLPDNPGYHKRVFLVPPWRELFSNDEDRRHDFSAAEDEYERLVRDYKTLGHVADVLPKMPVNTRANYVLSRLGISR